MTRKPPLPAEIIFFPLPPLPPPISAMLPPRCCFQTFMFSRAKPAADVRKQGRKYNSSPNSFIFHSGLWWPLCIEQEPSAELPTAAYIFFIPLRMWFIWTWIVPIVLPKACYACNGLSRILCAIVRPTYVLLWGLSLINFFSSSPDLSDLRRRWRREGGNFVLWTNVALSQSTTPSSGSQYESVTMLVLGAVPGAPPTINLFPCWELDFLLQLFDFYVIVCFQSMKELLPLTSR